MEFVKLQIEKSDEVSEIIREWLKNCEEVMNRKIEKFIFDTMIFGIGII